MTSNEVWETAAAGAGPCLAVLTVNPISPFPEKGLPFCGHGGLSAREWNGTWGPRGCTFGVAAAWSEVSPEQRAGFSQQGG